MEGFLHGIDISHHNTAELEIISKEQKFVFLKATEGESFVDDKFKSRWGMLKILGVKRGAYHFFRADKNPVSQAHHFCRIVGELEESDFPLVLDMETLDGKSNDFLKQSCKLFLDEVEKISGKIPIIYSGHSFLKELNLPESFNRYPLWLARYTENTPVPPAPWKEWTFWQYSETKKINGVGKCDCNWFKGDIS